MKSLWIAIAVAVLAAGPAAAQEKSDVMMRVHQFVDGFNKGDTTATTAACAGQTSIIDEFPPHEWHGARACAQWMDDYDADAKKNGITDGKVVLGKPRHVDVSAEHAYVVAPANYTYKVNGKPTKEVGSTLTLALQKIGGIWQITGWAWAKH